MTILRKIDKKAPGGRGGENVYLHFRTLNILAISIEELIFLAL